MKIALKIGAAVLGVVLAAALVVFIFFPGLPSYFRIKKDYPFLGDKLGEFSGFDVTVPDDFVEVKVGAISLRGPEDALTENSHLIPFKRTNELMVTAVVSDPSDYADYIDDNYDDGDELLSEEEENALFKKLGCGEPQNDYERNAALRKLKASDCIRLRGDDLKKFRKLAEARKIAESVEKLSLYEVSGLKGFVSEYTAQYTKKYTCSCAVWLFDGDIQYIVTVHSNDKDLAVQILSTVKINRS